MGFKNDKILICNTSRFFLRLSCVWPTEKEEVFGNKSFYYRLATFLFLSSFLLICLLYHFFMLLSEDDGDLSEDLCMISAFSGVIIMTILYAKRQKNIMKLLEDMSDFSTYGRPPQLDDLNKFLDFGMRFVYGYSTVGVIYFGLERMMSIPTCLEEGLHENCGLTIPSSTPNVILPTDYMIFIPVEIYYTVLVQIFSKMAIMISFHLFEIASHLTLRIKHLNSMILQCFDGSDSKQHRFNLKRCLGYHQEIIDFAQRLDDNFVNAMFMHLVLTAVVCGCLENRILINHELRSIIHIGGWIGALFIASVGGQQLHDASISVGDAAFNSLWYQADPRLRKDLILLIMRSQHPLRLRVGPFDYLSYPFFVAIMKMSYTVVTILG